MEASLTSRLCAIYLKKDLSKGKNVEFYVRKIT